MKIGIFNILIENINKLNPLDFLIIFALFVLVVFDCYLFFRWIYRDVYEAQIKSLQIKNGIISDLEKELTLNDQHRQKIEDQMNFVSSYATFLRTELEKVHDEKNKTEKERNVIKANAFKLEFTVVLLLVGKETLGAIKILRDFIIASMILAAQGKMPKIKKAFVHLYNLADIERRVIEAMSTVDPLIPAKPEEAFQKLNSSIIAPPDELRRFDFNSTSEEIDKIYKEIEPYREMLRGDDGPSKTQKLE